MVQGRKLEIIGYIHTDFPEKFGIPRQSGLVQELMGEIFLEPDYRRPEILMGIEEYSHLWLIWDFSMVNQEKASLTVCPPRLSGKERRGVFATRSPFRPNPIGLSCVRFEKIITDGSKAPSILVSGVDLMDGTPIYDIKPYLPYADCISDARGGFGEKHKNDHIEVVFPKELLQRLPMEKQSAVIRVLEQDPRAAYNKKPDYIYGMAFAQWDVRFTVKNGVLYVTDVVMQSEKPVK